MEAFFFMCCLGSLAACVMHIVGFSGSPFVLKILHVYLNVFCF